MKKIEFVFAVDPAVEDYIGWYIYSITSKDNIPVSEGTNIMVSEKMVIIQHTVNKITRQYTLISPETGLVLNKDGMNLKKFEGL